MATFVHLVRHGNVSNPTGVRYGRRAGFPLSNRGIGQSRLVARYFEVRGGIAAIYSGPLKRTIQTAESIGTVLGLPVISNDAVNEVLGNRFATGARPTKPRGESESDVAERMVKEVRRLAVLHQGQEVVVVSHGWPIALCVWGLEGDAFRRKVVFRCREASVTTIVFEGQRFRAFWYTELGTNVSLRDLNQGKVTFIFS